MKSVFLILLGGFVVLVVQVFMEHQKQHLEREEVRLLRQIKAVLIEIRRVSWEIFHLLQREHLEPTGMEILEIEGNMSTPAGSSSVFQEVPTPAGSQFPAGTTFVWSVDDTADISLLPTADGTGVTVTCVASPTGTSYNLTCQSSFIPPGASTGISATINVPIVVTPPTPTGMTINQLS